MVVHFCSCHAAQPLPSPRGRCGPAGPVTGWHTHPRWPPGPAPSPRVRPGRPCAPIPCTHGGGGRPSIGDRAHGHGHR